MLYVYAIKKYFINNLNELSIFKSIFSIIYLKKPSTSTIKKSRVFIEATEKE